MTIRLGHLSENNNIMIETNCVYGGQISFFDVTICLELNCLDTSRQTLNNMYKAKESVWYQSSHTCSPYIMLFCFF